MARALTASGFEVTLRLDVQQREMVQAIDAFAQTLAKDDVALFYYSGHARQSRQGKNVLIPVDHAQRGGRMRGVPLQQVQQKIARSCSTHVVILDASREPKDQQQPGGLAFVNAPIGSFVAFAAAPNAVAVEPFGKTSVYTQALVEALEGEATGIEELFKRVRSSVRKQTGGSQIPWQSNSLEKPLTINNKTGRLLVESTPQEQSELRVAQIDKQQTTDALQLSAKGWVGVLMSVGGCLGSAVFGGVAAALTYAVWDPTSPGTTKQFAVDYQDYFTATAVLFGVVGVVGLTLVTIDVW